MSSSFATDGAELIGGLLSETELRTLSLLAERNSDSAPGTRISNDEQLNDLIKPNSSLSRLAMSQLGFDARPVRCVLFDKSAEANWALGWHQDRTIAVREKQDTPGFGRWTRKGGIAHVEPPFSYIENMITLRVHLDPCGAENGPLLVAPGSHRMGRVPVSEIDAVVAECGRIECLAARGDVWLCATAIVHASEAAKSPAHRRLLMVDYSRDVLPPPLEWAGV